MLEKEKILSEFQPFLDEKNFILKKVWDFIPDDPEGDEYLIFERDGESVTFYRKYDFSNFLMVEIQSNKKTGVTNLKHLRLDALLLSRRGDVFESEYWNLSSKNLKTSVEEIKALLNECF